MKTTPQKKVNLLEDKINNVMLKFEFMGFFKKLSTEEMEGIEIELREIASIAIMEGNNAIQNILPNLSQQIISKV